VKKPSPPKPQRRCDLHSQIRRARAGSRGTKITVLRVDPKHVQQVSSGIPEIKKCDRRLRVGERAENAETA
jgi:hypothetical protein